MTMTIDPQSLKQNIFTLFSGALEFTFCGRLPIELALLLPWTVAAKKDSGCFAILLLFELNSPGLFIVVASSIDAKKASGFVGWL